MQRLLLWETGKKMRWGRAHGKKLSMSSQTIGCGRTNILTFLNMSWPIDLVCNKEARFELSTIVRAAG